MRPIGAEPINHSNEIRARVDGAGWRFASCSAIPTRDRQMPSTQRKDVPARLAWLLPASVLASMAAALAWHGWLGDRLMAGWALGVLAGGSAATLYFGMQRNARWTWPLAARARGRERPLDAGRVGEWATRKDVEAAAAGASTEGSLRGCSTAIACVALDRHSFGADDTERVFEGPLLDSIEAAWTACLRSGDQLFRISRSEFALVLWGINQPDEAISVGRRMVESAQHVLDASTADHDTAIAVGIAVLDPEEAHADAALRRAEQALLGAKGQGGGVRVFSRQLDENVAQQRGIKRELRTALTNAEFVLHYQARFAGRTRRLVGAEALLRWRHPTRGLLFPGEFIRVLEGTSLMLPVGTWILRRAVQQIAAWRSTGLVDIRVSVNVAPVQFEDPAFSSIVRDALMEHAVPPVNLELELTESMVVSDPNRAISTMRQLRGLGVQIAIDDFGVGFSSLSLLRSLPVDVLKIDRSFVKDVVPDERDQALARAIVHLASVMHLKTVAEGIESEEQAAVFEDFGCSELQGFYFHRPAPPDEVVGEVLCDLPGPAWLATRVEEHLD